LPKQSSEFFEAKRKFDSLRSGITINGKLVNLEQLIRQSPSPYTEPEWGFPKGRRHLKEEDVNCAVREFCEETAFEHSDIKLIKDLPPFEEIFFGTNNVLYRHVYYIASLQGDQHRNTVVNPQNINQAREVRAVSWFKYEDILKHIRPHNQERKDLFRQAHVKVLENLGKHGEDIRV
jgi:8-oxo-dGTP pyrophosphatase MutT (NUDIX family)